MSDSGEMHFVAPTGREGSRRRGGVLAFSRSAPESPIERGEERE
jgi:hypothetical protein